MRPEKQSVRAFYDRFGWRRDSNSVYGDTASFVDQRSVLDDYYRKVHLRALASLPARGQYFLDAGSGATVHSEQRAYSEGFGLAVCLDLSFVALVEARGRLHRGTMMVQGDLTHLPFRAGVFEASVCSHVLYHIPPDEQRTAILELYRTLKEGGGCLIVYTLPSSPLTRFAKRVRRHARRLASRIPRTRPVRTPTKDQCMNMQKLHPRLYRHSFNLQWFNESLPRDWDTEIRCWRSIGRTFSTTFVPGNIAGRLLLALIFRLESLFPQAMARLGQYPMIRIRK